MTGAVHGAALAIAAAAHNRLAFLFLFDHADDDSGDNADQHSADDDRPEVSGNPLEHLFHLDFLCQLARFFVRLEEHKQHARDKQDRDDQAEDASISSGSKEPRSALESRRVSLGAHWVD